VSDSLTTTPDENDTPKRTEPMSFAIKPDLKERLAAFRRKGGAINVSAICNAAIVAELDRAENPGFTDLVARLRVESDRRRGEPYRRGHALGASWATSRGSWAEICFYATLDESDVLIEVVTWVAKDKSKEWQVPTFKSRFVPPVADYPLETWNKFGAPSYPAQDIDESEAGWVSDRDKCDQYWRGWLAGVKQVYQAVSEVLDPIEPQPPIGVPKPSPVPVDVDPDDIPF
jgi:hypothetical protein